MLDKTYDAAIIEPRVSALWETTGAFKAGAGAKPGADVFSIAIPPPNVTGSLHLGHALNNTLQDVLVRYHRMRGFDVLWQPGTDHAGIATQMVVERQMMERQEPSRRDLGRERFIEKVWQWKAESGSKIINQLKRLGASCDWSRERFTMDDGLSQAVVKIFVDLHRQGLIYRDKRLVNWDPKLHTAHLRPGGSTGRNGRPSMAFPLSDRRQRTYHYRRHHPTGDNARRHRNSSSSG